MIRNKIYYPKSHIVENLYTSGKEWMTEDGTEYIGYYHRYIDGKVATGAVYSNTQSVALIKYINVVTQPDNTMYNSLVKKSNNFTSPKQIIPIPTNDDYEKGKFVRYFLRRRNYSTFEDMLEVDANQFKLWERVGSGINENLYDGLSLDWKLTGPLNDITQSNNVVYGVADTNKRMVLLKDYDFPGLKSFLTDYIEFSVYSPYVKPEIKKLFG